MTEPDSTGLRLTGRDGMIQHLAASGLNLFACLAGRDLLEQRVAGLDRLGAGVGAAPDAGSAADFTDNSVASAVESHENPLAQQSFLLIGNAGPAFWEACQASKYAEHTDPVDEFSSQQVAQALARFAPDIRYCMLYPGPDCGMPLQDLGAMAGWHQPSPLGIGIHPDAGLWFAYRALVLVEADWSSVLPKQLPADHATEHCLHCRTQDCLAACPADALAMARIPDLQRCGDYRLRDMSPCEAQCLARNACPVAPAQRYGNEQIRHHYVASLDALRRYLQADRPRN